MLHMQGLTRWLSLLVTVTTTLAGPITVNITSGSWTGVDEDGVMSFKGVRFGEAPVGHLRFEPPVPFVSSATKASDATRLGPSCIQKFINGFHEMLFNNPQDPPEEDEDCLFLNVWAPSGSASQENIKKPVLIWFFGGGLVFGTASLPAYDGTSLAKNQDIIVVTINYRTNIFGFPSSPELPLEANNLGFLDQELAMAWVKENIVQFGGDPEQVSIMGQSGGAFSVASALLRHSADDAPFRAGILISGASPDLSPTPSFTTFNEVSTALGCDQSPGDERLACLRNVPAETIRTFINGPGAHLSYGRPVADNVTAFANNMERLQSGDVAQVPIYIGNTQDDGSLFAVGQSNLTAFLDGIGASAAQITPYDVRSVYPDLNDSAVIAASLREIMFTCSASLWAARYADVSTVFRYEYGAAFADLQVFPNAGAWHWTDLQEIFGNYNASTASPDEVELSKTYQTIVANFIKAPNTSPAPNWPKYVPGSQNVARIAYKGNVELNNVVETVQNDLLDAPCALWNRLDSTI
ncbi:hypothetical protein D9758_010267 [Tetrapyrgos nigripes]|uniref:Carboxylic ester hydrolase n=1 Tax=Tetrapyrgos nigripes TaxID=182062 RepID=A0A8H5GAD8_9AGAR|nr:hypothetical protein D9758_010267 [Tetrapyrgos nigripes]